MGNEYDVREATQFALQFSLDEIQRDLADPLPGERHLILDHDEAAAARHEMLVQTACAGAFVSYDRAEHTFMTRFTTCPACVAVNTARIAVLDAAEGITP